MIIFLINFNGYLIISQRIVNDIDTSKFSKNDFDYISVEKLNQLKSISSDYKDGNKDDFEEYNLWYINWYLIRKLSSLFKKEI